MRKFMKKRLNQKGLTLIELLAVIVILAIIAAIAIPAIGNIINKQRDKAILSDASGIISAAKIAYADGACGTDNSCSGTELGDYLDKKLEGKDSIVVSLATTGTNEGKWSLTWNSGKEFKVITTGVTALEDGSASVLEDTILGAMNNK